MLKRSLLTVAILGVLVGVAGAHSEGDVEKAKDLQKPPIEFAFETAPATCGAVATEAQGDAWLVSLLEPQNAARVDETEAPSLYARGWGGGSSWCMICSYVCYLVRC